MDKVRKILCLAPHCDDIEFSCGASISKFIEEDYDVYMAVFSFCDPPSQEAPNPLRKEFENATQHLGIFKNIIKFNYKVRVFSESRQAILEDLIILNKSINPDLVIIPNSHDIHQDHKTIHNEAIRAFKRIKIIGYEMPWNNFSSTNNFHIKVEKKHIEAQLRSISEYKSQIFRGYSDEELIWGLGRVRGSQIGSRYAQSFELIRWVI